ncbi:hypothetical protein ACTXT7_008522 [Hymenolepis weldensis]
MPLLNSWPPSNYSPDPNPLALLRVGPGVIEKKVNKHSHNSKSFSSMETIPRAMEDMNKDRLEVAFWVELREVVSFNR